MEKINFTDMEKLDECCIIFDYIINEKGNKCHRSGCWIDVEKMLYHDESIKKEDEQIIPVLDFYIIKNNYNRSKNNIYLIELYNNKDVLAIEVVKK